VKVRFWGTRGSIAKAGPSTLRYGGNTSCVEIRSDSGTLVVLDCGTGAQNLGQVLMEQPPQRGHVLISHTHWDHIQGIPFFAPFFAPGNEWDVYAPRGISQSLHETLAGQMQYAYFPVALEALGATIRYHELVEGVFEVGDITVRAQYLNHTALTLGYRLEADGVAVVYASDHEPHLRRLASGEGAPGDQDLHHVDFLRDADLAIHDAQYSAEEYPAKVGWGHSTFEYAVEMNRLAGVRRLAMTHHDPMRDDAAVDRLQAAARARLRPGDHMEVFAAAEGMTVELEPSADPARKTAKPEFSAVTPESVLWAVKSQRPSLILLDGGSPEIDAFDLCSRIRGIGDEYARETPIIVVADAIDTDAGAASGVSDWLIRPFSTEYVRTRLRALVLRSACRWIRAPKPDDETRRLTALRRLAILDSEPEERFDRITRIAAAMFDVPIALVSLVDEDRQWFKSCVGLDVQETSRDVAFCAHAILDSNVMVVPDTFLDPRFADNPLVTDEPRLRFYAGYPLTLPDNTRVGTLCILDTRPRELDARKLALLRDLGSLVEREVSAARG
jgi:phosphoribosyl 1,2-cyclic phosphodiesterase